MMRIPLVAADVSFAIGTGIDIAIETADLNLVSGDTSKIADVMELSGETLAVIIQNLFWALGYYSFNSAFIDSERS